MGSRSISSGVRWTVMRSDVPHFRGSASEDDEPRWEAYRALLRRSAASELEATPKAKVEPRSFTIEEAERAYADAAPGTVAEADPLDFEAGEEVRASEPLKISREAPVVERRVFAPLASRNGRLVSATAAVTAGLVLAAAVFPRQQTEPAVIIWDHSHPAGSATAPPKTPAPNVHMAVAKASPARTPRRGRAAKPTYRTAPAARSHECVAAKAQARQMRGSLAAEAQQRVRRACGVQTVQVTKPPIGDQTLNF